MYLTELASSEKEGIDGQLNHANCIINALSDIKPEIENVIKMGRKIVESEAVVQDKQNLAKKIDALKKDFNDTGTEVKMGLILNLVTIKGREGGCLGRTPGVKYKDVNGYKVYSLLQYQ